MIRVYHAPKTRSTRIVWLLEELGVPCEIRRIEFPKGLQTPEYRKIHPLGSLPAIEDGDLTMFESGAITEYLVETHGKGRLAPAPGSPLRAAYLQWSHFGEATLLPPLGVIAQHSMLLPEDQRVPDILPWARGRLERILGALDRALEGREWMLGDELTAADVMVGYGVALAGLFGAVGPELPNVAAYRTRVESRPGFRKAWE